MPIEQHAPELERIVPRGQDVEELAHGFGGDMGPAEGPVWWKEEGYLLFSDIHNNRRMQWTPGRGVTLFHEPTDYANGLTRDRQGRLIACEHSARRVTRLEPDGSITVVANRYHDRRLNRPNDVVVKSDGSIYFTDPMTFNVESELDFCGVYRVTPDLGTINLLVWSHGVKHSNHIVALMRRCSVTTKCGKYAIEKARKNPTRGVSHVGSLAYNVHGFNAETLKP